MSRNIPKRETLRKKEADTPERSAASPEIIGGHKPKPDPLEAFPEGARSDPVIESSARQAPEVRPEDEENADGENEAAQLVEDGIAAADDEQAEEAERRDAARARRGEG